MSNEELTEEEENSVEAYKTLFKHQGKEVSYNNLKWFCRLRPSLEDACAFFGVSHDTITRRCKEYEGVGFREFRERHMMHTKYNLIAKAIIMAETNPQMLKYVLSNISNWSDKKEVKTEQVNTLIDWLHSDDNEIDVTPEIELIED